VNPRVLELAGLCSYPLVKRWRYDWAPIETELGLALPSEYKDYVSYFPPGVFGGVITPEHPGLRGGPARFVERIRLLADLFRGWPNEQRPPMPGYPEQGGLIPWADFEGDSALCWLSEGDDPDLWPVFAANDENRYERLPGTTIEALIAVLRGDAGRSVFPATFYERLGRDGEPFHFNYDQGPSPDVELGPFEDTPQDPPPAGSSQSTAVDS